jgi:arylformamidase
LRIWDISRPLRPGIPCWPGDAVYQEAWTMRIGPDCPVNVGQLAMSTHTGTHVDAPLHYDAAGRPVAEIPLDVLVGPCRVLDVTGAAPLVSAADLRGRAAGVERVLLRTKVRSEPDRWDPDFTAIEPAAMRVLAAAGVRLIGTDAPSIDPQESRTLDAHMVARDAGMTILEGLALDAVPPGDYELIALPLRLANLDASPVRAVLRELPP